MLTGGVNGSLSMVYMRVECVRLRLRARSCLHFRGGALKEVLNELIERDELTA